MAGAAWLLAAQASGVGAIGAQALGAQALGAQPAPALSGCDPDGPSPPFLSAASEIRYGCGWLFRAAAPRYASAAGRFESALRSEPRNAVAHFLLGVALLGDRRPDSARAAFARAAALDPGVRAALAPRLAERPALRDRVDAFLAGRAESGSVAAAVGPADGPAAPAAPAARPGPALGGPLAYGAYACTHDTWAGPAAARRFVSTPKGAITLRADGTYRYRENGGAGRYRYDAGTGAVTWLSGPLADQRPERTAFRRNRRTAQLDITFRDPYAWSCGTNLR